MPRAIQAAIPAELHAHLAELAELAPLEASCTPSAVAAWIVRQHLAARARRRAARARELMAAYWPVARAVAARAFQRCRGAVPLDELISAATEQMALAAHRFDEGLGFSPAPYLRRWAEFGVRALLQERLQEQDVHPDQDEDGGRWERLGERDEALEQAPDGRHLAAALERYRQGLDRTGRAILAGLLQERDDDEVAARAGCALDQVDRVRADLCAHLRAAGLEPRPDDELSPAEVAQRFWLSPKVVYKALASGALRGRKRGGAWAVREADARAFAARRFVGEPRFIARCEP